MTIVTPRRFTLAEYHRLGELGFFHPDEQVELIRGEIVQMPLKKTPHSVCNTRLVRQLIRLVEDRAIVRGQEPIVLPSDSEPQPDAVLARLCADEYLSAHPGPDDILLAIEISDATLQYDRQTKLSLYAEDGLPHYWIFNLVDMYLETYSEPYRVGSASPTGNRKNDFNYRTRRIVFPNETILLPSFPQLSLDLEQIFPNP